MTTTLLKSTIGLLGLRSIKGVGDVTLAKLVERFADFDEMLDAGDDDFKKVANKKVAELVRDKETIRLALDSAFATLDEASLHRVEVLSPYDERYPVRLLECYNRPDIIYIKGELEALDRSVTCVGTSEPSYFGQKVSERLPEFLIEAGWSIMSGLTGGIETTVVQAALAKLSPAIGVVGSGLNAMDTHRRRLSDDILESGGCILSEQHMNEREDTGPMIRRYRLMTCLSAATFLMQSSTYDTCLHAVRYAIQHGRPIFVPATPDKFLDDEKCAVATMLATLEGPELARKIDMKEAVIERLLSDYSSSSVATAINGREQYSEILELLEGYVEPAPLFMPSGSSGAEVASRLGH